MSSQHNNSNARSSEMGNTMHNLPHHVAAQVTQACDLISHHLSSTLQAIHLYGSAVDGGLQPYSDIDLLVTVTTPLEETARHALLLDLLTVSSTPGHDARKRALEVTVVCYEDLVPWRYPARRELQFGEWLRQDILAGIFEPAVTDIDLAILLTKARQHSITLLGLPAKTLFEPVPTADFSNALVDTLKQWNSPEDWIGDERNVILALARIWYSAVTGNIASKDVAALWLLERLPVEYVSVVNEAKQGYLGIAENNLTARVDQVKAFILFAKSSIMELLTVHKDLSN